MLVCLCGCIGSIVYPILLSARPVGPRVSSLSNVKQLTTGWLVYVSDFDDVSCPSAHWNDVILPYIKDPDTFLDPHLKKEVEQRGFGYSPMIAKLNLARVEEPGSVVAFGLTSNPGKDALLTSASVRLHDNYTLFGFVDGHAKTFSEEEMSRVVWRPKLLKLGEE